VSNQRETGGDLRVNRTTSEARILELHQELARLQQGLEQSRRDCLSLETERAHFELFTDCIPDHAFVALDGDGRVVRWNVERND
jgi:hypothetical protein